MRFQIEIQMQVWQFKFFVLYFVPERLQPTQLYV